MIGDNWMLNYLRPTIFFDSQGLKVSPRGTPDDRREAFSTPQATQPDSGGAAVSESDGNRRSFHCSTSCITT
jgi:hypothetical protein